jgi:general secretion pathway protein K
MSRSKSSDGYVTLAILVMAALFAGLVSTLLAVARPSVDLTRIGVDEVAAEGLLDGGLNAAGYLLYAAKQAPSAVNGLTLDLQSGSIRLAVVDESGRIDLNASDPMLLEGLFEAVKGKSLSPSAFAARVNDWRDEDEDIANNGAEADDYASAGLGYGPRNGPFASVGELRLLLGLSEQDFLRLEPHLTVYNPNGLIDPFSASRTVLLAVPDLSQADVDKLAKAYGAPQAERESIFSTLGAGAEWLMIDASGVYRVTVTARRGEAPADVVQAVLTQPKDETDDFGVVAWSRLPATAAAE